MKYVIGLHLRIFTHLQDTIARAHTLGLPCFQFFLLDQKSGKYISLHEEEAAAIRAELTAHAAQPFLHASYWINLASGKTRGGQHVLRKELKMAQQLGVRHIVIHPGSATGDIDKAQGIKNFVRRTKRIIKDFPDMILVLENSAFGKKTLGGAIEELALLAQKIDMPDQIRYCIDTAHAHAYGYDLSTQQGYTDFVALLDSELGIENISLLHINDTLDECGSKKDKHAALCKGHLKKALPWFVADKRLAAIPMIAELPPMESAEEEKILEVASSWQKGD